MFNARAWLVWIAAAMDLVPPQTLPPAGGVLSPALALAVIGIGIVLVLAGWLVRR